MGPKNTSHGKAWQLQVTKLSKKMNEPPHELHHMSVMIAQSQNIYQPSTAAVSKNIISRQPGRLINSRMRAVSHFSNLQQSLDSTHLRTKNKFAFFSNS